MIKFTKEQVIYLLNKISQENNKFSMTLNGVYYKVSHSRPKQYYISYGFNGDWDDDPREQYYKNFLEYQKWISDNWDEYNLGGQDA